MSDAEHEQGPVQLTYAMSADQVEAVMGAVAEIATSTGTAVELIGSAPGLSELYDQPPEILRGLVVQYVLERTDERNTLSTPNLLSGMTAELGLKHAERIGTMRDLTEEGILVFRRRNEIQPEAISIFPHTVRGAVDSGYLILPPKEEPLAEQPTAEIPDSEGEREQEQPYERQPTIQPPEPEVNIDGRTERNALYSGDETKYSLTATEVAALSDEAFLQLILTTRTFTRRGFHSNEALKDAISEASGLEEERREKAIIGLLKRKLVVHSRGKGYRYNLTEAGEEHLKQQIAGVKS